jgi:hypothetical protein
MSEHVLHYRYIGTYEYNAADAREVKVGDLIHPWWYENKHYKDSNGEDVYTSAEFVREDSRSTFMVSRIEYIEETGLFNLYSNDYDSEEKLAATVSDYALAPLRSFQAYELYIFYHGGLEGVLARGTGYLLDDKCCGGCVMYNIKKNEYTRQLLENIASCNQYAPGYHVF